MKSRKEAVPVKRFPLWAKLMPILAAALTLVGVILRTVAMYVCFDREVGYFDSSFLPTLLTVLSVVAALLPILLAILTPKGSLPTVWPEEKRGLIAVLPLLLCAISGFLMLWASTNASASTTLLTCTAVLTLFSALYYFLVTAQALGKRANTNAVAAIGYAPVLWGLFAMAETYTDQFTTMNSPIKLGLQFGFLGVMLVTISELRFRLHKPTPRASLCFHCIAMFFCFTGSIPTLIYLLPTLLGAAPANAAAHCAYALVLLGVGAYATVRLCFYITASPIEASETSETAETAEAPSADTEGAVELAAEAPASPGTDPDPSAE